MSIDTNDYSTPGANIKVIGIGGGGCNAVNTMIRESIDGVDFINANTDVQSLKGALAQQKLQIGKELTRGLGAGADPDIGRDAALEDRHELTECLTGADMVFITAGMGGGTGTGGAPVIAQLAREAGALTVGVVTKPFHFEGKRRRKFAEMGIQRLKEHVDTLIVIPNEKLISMAAPELSMIDAFKMADSVLVNAVKGITEVINVEGIINLDFADVKTVMSGMGHALMGIGAATGTNRAQEAAIQAIKSPLLEDIDIEGATGILVNVTSGKNIAILELNQAVSVVQEAAHEDANIICGTVIDESMEDEIRVTVIATGFPMETENFDMARKPIKKTLTNHEYKSEPSKFGEKSKPVIEREIPASLVESRVATPKPIEQTKEVVLEGATTSSVISSPSQIPSCISEEKQSQTKSIADIQSEDFEEEEHLAKITLEETAPPKENQVEHERKSENITETISEMPSSSFEDSFISSDIDKTIDQAIKLTAEMSKVEEMDEDDDIHVPAFLRDSSKGGPNL